MLKTKIKKLPKSQIEIEGELDTDAFESYFQKALKRLGEDAEIDGFRKGKAPESVLLSKIPEMHILEEMASLALSEHYPKILEEEKIDAISRPKISITKLARKNPLSFKIETSVMPEVKMPDYKKIAKKINEESKKEEKGFEATDEETENTILDIRKSRAPKIKMPDMKEGEAEEKMKEEELPPLDDAFVQSLGPFKDVADFREKLKENIKLEKQNAEREKTRLKIAEKIIEEMEVDLPEVLVEAEVDKILHRMESDISAMGIKFEDYLKHTGKTEEDIRKEFRKDGEKKSKLSLALNEIAKNENLYPDKDTLANETAKILEHYKEADPEQAEMYAQNVLTNEKVFEFLENQK